MKSETANEILMRANRLFLLIYLAAFGLFVELILLALFAFVLTGV